jgi:hypothetical protein
VRVVAVNVLILAGLVMGLLLILSIVGDASNLAKSFFPKGDSRAALPVYEDHAYALKVYKDQKGSIKNYVPFVAWRQTAKTSATLNIDENGYRLHTVGLDNAARATTLGFFGGSTVWGTGVDDNGTIPAHFDAITEDYVVTDYSERGYTTMQNLIDLIVLVNQGKAPETVIYYGGAADIWVHCNDTVTRRPNSHMEENRIRAALDRTGKTNYVMNNIVQPILALLTKFVGGRDGYSGACGQDPAQAGRVAKTWVANLETMRQIVSGYGGNLVAFYQPTAFSGAARADHLDPEDDEMADLARQYKAVDPWVLAELAERKLAWIVNLGDALDGDDYLLIDYAHLASKGNGIIAERIKAALN